MARRLERVRYAVVGLGHIAQVAVLPAFAHARRNSELAALVSDDDEKLKALGRKYPGTSAYSYAEYDECLKQVDAVFIALPNALHAEYSIRAARAGVHVLCEKPMAVTADECERMIAACDDHGVRLMIAYRLHFEAINLEAIELVRRGRIGEPKVFNSTFTMRVRPGNIRTRGFEEGGGTLYDIGVYCINAARYLFRAEPQEVVALAVNGGAAHLSEIDESTGAVLRFEGGRVATFVTSFNAAGAGSYEVIGTKGRLRVAPAYEYAEGLAYELTVGGRTRRKRIGRRDQFAAELLYFSDCVRKRRAPEPSGAEGLQDVRIIQALNESAAIGKAVELPPFNRSMRPTAAQQIERQPVKKPALVKVRSAGRD